MRQPSCASPDGDMNNVEVGQNAPHSVDLGVVSIDLRDNEKDETKGDGGAEARYEWVGIDVELQESAGIPSGLEQPLR